MRRQVYYYPANNMDMIITSGRCDELGAPMTSLCLSIAMTIGRISIGIRLRKYSRTASHTASIRSCQQMSNYRAKVGIKSRAALKISYSLFDRKICV